MANPSVVAYDRISFRVEPANLNETISQAQSLYNRHFDGNDFSWSILADRLNDQFYTNEKTSRNQIIVFTGLAIVIACLGLLGMITNKAIEKTKEIGIRKVLGAGQMQIGSVLLNTTMKHVLFATTIGLPVSYYLTQSYLQRYTDQIQLSWWQYLVPILMLLVILFATIASVLWRAARTNPVQALKYE